MANIGWRYKTTDDNVKVEVWDVVDVGKRTRSSQGGTPLKLTDEVLLITALVVVPLLVLRLTFLVRLTLLGSPVSSLGRVSSP